MHGRLKIRTPTEMDIIKKKEKLDKAQKFKKALDRLIQKRNDLLLDDEAFEITKILLLANPDVYTVWNIRREILLDKYETWEKDQSKKQNVQSKEQNDQSIEQNDQIEEKTDSIEESIKAELSFTEQCLRNSPKSYGTWHHRLWSMKKLPKPDWEKELRLLNRYLEYDERNFHCWDYRRFVVEQLKVPQFFEFEFTTDKIMANFSNYSAWHLRSKLLPDIFPDPTGRFAIREDFHKNELDLVHNATFTDPDDQSGWFYLRWLLALPARPLSICQATIISTKFLTVVFSLPIKFGDYNCVVKSEDKEYQGKWTNSKKRDTSTQVWFYSSETDLPKKENLTVELVDKENLLIDTITLKKERRLDMPCAWKPPCFDHNLGKSLKDTLSEELLSCRKLLELEENNKWTLLTMVYIMQALDRNRYREETLTVLEKLIKCDKYRCNFYKDMRSRFIIETVLDRGFSSEYPLAYIDLSKRELTTLYHTEYFSLAQRLNLSCNNLTNDVFHSFIPIQNCEELDLSGNSEITTLKELPEMRSLKKICLKETGISEDECPSTLKDCKIEF